MVNRSLLALDELACCVVGDLDFLFAEHFAEAMIIWA